MTETSSSHAMRFNPFPASTSFAELRRDPVDCGDMPVWVFLVKLRAA